MRLYDWLTASEAWRDLSGNAVKLLIYIATFDNGSNNGELFMSERHAADGIHVSKKTAHRLLAELQEKGFLAQTAPGSFKTKRSPAAQWRLTFKPWPSRSKGPTNEWRNWRASKKSGGEFLPTTGVVFSQSAPNKDSAGVDITPAPNAESQFSAKRILAKSTPQIIAIEGDDPGSDATGIIRSAILEWWRLANAKDRVRLAKNIGLELIELQRFIDGSADLAFPKLVALRSAIKQLRVAA